MKKAQQWIVSKLANISLDKLIDLLLGLWLFSLGFSNSFFLGEGINWQNGWFNPTQNLLFYYRDFFLILALLFESYQSLKSVSSFRSVFSFKICLILIYLISISFWATYPYLHLFSLSQVILIGIGIYRSEKRKVSQRFLAWGLLIFPFWHLIHHFWQHLNFINLPDRHFMGFFALGGIIFFQNSRQHNLKYLLLFPLILSQSWAVYISSLIWALLNWRTWKLISSASCLIISALIFAYLIPQTGLQLPDFALIQTNLTSALKNLMLFPQGLGLGHFPLIWQNSPILLSPWEMEYQTNLYLFISNELGLLFFSFGIYYLYRYWKNFSLHLQKLFQFLLLSGSFYSIWVTDLRLLILISIMVYNFLITTPQNQLDKKGFSS